MKSLANLTHMLRQWDVSVIHLAIALVLVMSCSISFAQSGAGSIQGTVMDMTGAIIPGASIHVVNQATGVVTNAKSNGVGFYEVPDLFTGDYSVTVTAPGMETYQTTIQLLVAQDAVINPSLTAGAVTQQVTVSGNAVQLTTTDNGSITSTLENARIDQLPMNGRELVTLVAMVTPGLEGGTRDNGLYGGATEYVADGVSLTDREFFGYYFPEAMGPDPDSVQEMTVVTSNGSAQYTQPGSVILTTKSGTNSLHGTFFETARNNAWGIAKARQNPAIYAAPHYVRNEFGGSAGGPIVLPHLYNGKDKSFWFFAYERYSLASNVSDLASVYTPAMKGGDWSGLVNSAGTLQTLYDPTTTQSSANCNGSGAANAACRAPFANNQISTNRLSPLGKVLFAMTPSPTSTADPLVSSNLNWADPDYDFIPTITFRFDHNFNEANKAYLRYTQNIESTCDGQYAADPLNVAAEGVPAGAINSLCAPLSSFAAAIGFTHVFSPTFSSETIISQQWLADGRLFGNASLPFASMFGLPNNFGKTGIPQIAGGLQTWYSSQNSFKGDQIVSTIDENFTKIVGRNQIHFGGRYQHERMYYGSGVSDKITFGDYASALLNPASGANYTATPNTGYTDADLFLGAPDLYVNELQGPFFHSHDMEFDGYVQDDIHVNSRLTVNLGLRYEDHPAFWTKDLVLPSFDFKNTAVVMGNPISYYIAKGYTTQAIVTNLENIGVVFETAAQAGFPQTVIRNYPVDFNPRVGVAYNLFGSKHGTVIRGAYGRYTYPTPLRFGAGPPITNPSTPPYTATYQQSYIAANQSPDGLPNYLLRAPQTVIAGTNSANVVNSNSTTATLPGAPSGVFDNPDFPPYFVTQVNATLEQSLKGNSALRVSYVYTHGTNMDQDYYPNDHPSNYVWEMQKGIVPPTGTVIGSNQYAATATGPYNQTTYGNMALIDKLGWSNYNALQASYQRLFHHGVAYQISYVWDKPFIVGGDASNNTLLYPSADYINGAPIVSAMTSPYGVLGPVANAPIQPSNIASYAVTKAMDRFQNYQVDSATPTQHITFNGIVDLPIGRGKRFFGNANRFVNELIGGFQLAGDGQVISQDFRPAIANFGPTNPLVVYKHKAPITDCRSGVCYKSFEWFNGYLAPTVVPANSTNAKCTLAPGLVTGLPSNWAPYQSPIDTDCDKSDAAYTYYGENEVSITLPGGKPAAIAYSPGPQGSNPYSHTFIKGPNNWNADLSIYKVFPITERVNMRFNMDAFNAFNVQGYNNPNATDGTEAVQPGAGVASSYWTPRQIQLTLRLTF